MTAEAEYRARRTRWNAEKQKTDQLFRRIGNWRLAVAAVAVALAYAVFAMGRLPASILWVPAVAFAALVAVHGRVARRQRSGERALRYYDRLLARCEDRWQETGATGERFLQADHLYAADLDLFGGGGLFQMVAEMRTATGEETLAAWLLEPAERQEALARQEAVRELGGRLDLREALALLGPDLASEADAQAFEQWAAQPPIEFPRVLRVALLLLGGASVTCLVAFFAQAAPPSLLLLFIAVDVLVGIAVRGPMRRVLASAETASHGLAVLAEVIGRFERESFASAKLMALRLRLETQGKPASVRIHQLARRMDWLASSDHALVRALAPLIFFREQLAMALESWRRISGSSMAGWMRTVGELEALCSLAALHYERPEWTFAELSEAPGVFEGTDLEHPLLPRARSVSNNVALSPPQQVLVVSGSNMSGKSTLLRAIGINTVLAWAGAPVAASRLRLSRLTPGASIRVGDSLQDGRSRFFAEITKLRAIVAASAGSSAVLFLLDELLSGTNSSDRRVGAEAIVRGLVEDGAIGLITTHDLALTAIADGLGDRAANVHFEDRIGGDGMEFDYKLKDGVVTHSNALALMRAVGLKV